MAVWANPGHGPCHRHAGVKRQLTPPPSARPLDTPVARRREVPGRQLNQPPATLILASGNPLAADHQFQRLDGAPEQSRTLADREPRPVISRLGHLLRRRRLVRPTGSLRAELGQSVLEEIVVLDRRLPVLLDELDLGSRHRTGRIARLVAQIGNTASSASRLRLLKNLHALHMTPLARARACGRWPWQGDADVGGGDDAA